MIGGRDLYVAIIVVRRNLTAVISAKGSKIPVVVLPTNEELMIARDTVRVLGN